MMRTNEFIGRPQTRAVVASPYIGEPLNRQRVVADACRVLRLSGPRDAVAWLTYCVAVGVDEP
jgi:hypothetical protein